MLSQHPANLVLRLVLEIVGLVAAAQWGWERSASWSRILIGVGLPLVIAGLWVTLTTPGDWGQTKRALIPVPGKARLLLEIFLYGISFWFMLDSGRGALGAAFLVTLLLHYFWSADRLIWLYRH